MAEPHTTVGAALAGQALAIPVAGIVAALGVPLDLLGWAMFGGLVAMANSEPRQPPREGLRLIASVALSLAIASGVGGAFAPIGSAIVIGLAAKAGIVIENGAVLLRAAAIVIGGSTAFLPEAMRLARVRLASMSGSAS